MAFDNAAEIVQMVNEAEKVDGFNQLLTRFEEDFDLYNLVEYVPPEGYEAYTSSAPRNFFEKITDGVNRADLQIQIQLGDDVSKKKRAAAQTGELFLLGAIDDMDRTFRRRGEPRLREQLAWYIVARGWYILTTIVHVQQESTQFRTAVWDPLHTTYLRGSNGLIWVANKRKLINAQAKAEYGDKVGNAAFVELIDFLDEENNSIIIDGHFVKDPTKHGANHCPAHVGAVGSMPTILTKNFQSTQDKRGDSAWATSRNLYEPRNRIVSTLMDIWKRTSTGSIVYQSIDGTKGIEGDPWGEFQVIKIAVNEEIKPLEFPRAPPETAAVLGIVDRDTEQSTLPFPEAWGKTQQELSGRALDILSEGTKSVFTPRTGALEEAFTWLCEEILWQYATNGKPMTMKGFKPNKDESPSYFEVAVKPEEIDKEWFVTVTVDPRTPRDRESEIMMALAATQQRGPNDEPLMSKDSARQNVMKLANAGAEGQKVLVEMANALLIPARTAEALAKSGDKESLRAYLLQLPPEIRAGITGEAPPTEGQPGGNGAQPSVEQLGGALQESIKRIQLLEVQAQQAGMPPLPLPNAQQGIPVGT